jgi:hypothetical protein
VLSDLVREMKKIPVLGVKIERDRIPAIYSLACERMPALLIWCDSTSKGRLEEAETPSGKADAREWVLPDLDVERG